ncbi:hypothetical protein BsWGS_05013 [Bradybaena similaris]
MDQRRGKQEKDTLLEMGSLNPDRKEENMVQMKRMQAETNVIGDDRTPDEGDDNENTSVIDNEIIEEDDSSSSCEEDEHSHVIDPNSCKGKIEHAMKSNVVQYCIIALVIADCLIIVLELLIDMEFIQFPDPEPPTSHHTNGDSHPVAYASLSLNSTTHLPEHEESLYHNSSSNYNSSHGEHHPHHHTNKEKAEHVLHAFSLGILSLFMVEVCMKIFVEGTHLLKQKAEVFDAVVVVVSFTLDIVFSFVSVESAAKDAAGLMVLLRLWRVTRIINGVILSVKIEAKKKTDALKKVVRQLEHDNRKQRSKIDKLEKENTLLKQQMVVLNDGSARRTNTVLLSKKLSNPPSSIQITTEMNNHGDRI